MFKTSINPYYEVTNLKWVKTSWTYSTTKFWNHDSSAVLICTYMTEIKYLPGGEGYNIRSDLFLVILMFPPWERVNKWVFLCIIIFEKIQMSFDQEGGGKGYYPLYTPLPLAGSSSDRYIWFNLELGAPHVYSLPSSAGGIFK